MNKPHKHAEIIHAYADGAEIEVYSPLNQKWMVAGSPAFDPDFQYRIKPAAPMIETNITGDELEKLYDRSKVESRHDAFTRIANTAIARAIADGQVMPIPQPE